MTRSNMRDLTAQEGRSAFGADAANYDAARPPYPGWVFERLRRKCGLAHGTRAFEIGPGTGLATGTLLALGASPLVAIEPDARLAAFLGAKHGKDGRLHVVNAAFEDASLAPGSFDLGTAATSFHWMDQRAALAKVAAVLRRGGWWAAWWNVFGDPDRSDAFHDATDALLNGLGNTPSHHAGQAHPFGLDVKARLADLQAVDAFERVECEIQKWTLTLTTSETRALYATYSQFSVLEPDERARILDGVAHIAETQFGGRVERNMCTALYTAPRR
ncbi:MAG TPA: methyltransferase domain-containing protein [Rhizomicrobium sp.]